MKKYNNAVSRIKKISLPIVLVIFFILSIPDIDNPGLNIDEADDAVACDSIVKANPVFTKELSASYFITLFNKSVPIMHGPYTGRIHAYIMFLLSRVFGLNIFSIRFTPVLMSAVTLIFIYLFCKMWFSYVTAIVTTMLTATNILFIQYSRVGNYREEIFIISFFWMGLYFLFRFLKEWKSLFLFISFLLFGLGLCTKVNMLFYLAGLGAGLIILNREFNFFRKTGIKHIALILAGVSLGSFNLILFNILYKGKSFRFLLNSLRQPAFYGYNNLDYSKNLYMRAHDLLALLKGSIYEMTDWGVAGRYLMEGLAPLLAALVIISFVFSCVICPRDKNFKYRLLFFIILYSTVFLLTPFTPVGAHPAHLLLLLPFPQVTIALSMDYIWARLRNKKIALGTIFTLLLPFLVFNISKNMHFYKEMKKNGGYGRWSTAIYELSFYLEKEKIFSPVTFGFGLKENIAFLTGYGVKPVQLEENRSVDEVKEAYSRLSSGGAPVFFLTKNTEDYKPNLDFFMGLAARGGKDKEIYKIFYNRAGAPVYWLYRIN